MKCIRAILDERDQDNPSAVGIVERINTLASYCKIHPDQETILQVSSASKSGTVRVVSICCQDFRNQLIRRGLILR